MKGTTVAVIVLTTDVIDLVNPKFDSDSQSWMDIPREGFVYKKICTYENVL